MIKLILKLACSLGLHFWEDWHELSPPDKVTHFKKCSICGLKIPLTPISMINER